MPQEGYIMDSTGNMSPFPASQLTDSIRNKHTFFCRCRLQITANIPIAKGRKPYYSSKAKARHAPECPYFHSACLEKIIKRIDPTGKNIASLEELLKGITSGGDIPEPASEEKKNCQPVIPASPYEEAPPEEIKILIKKRDKPTKLLDLYELIKNPDIDTYAGHDPKELIIDRHTVPFLNVTNILGVKVAVVKRCKPTPEMKNWLFTENIADRAIFLRAPIAYPRFMEGQRSPLANRIIYYLLIFPSRKAKSDAFNKLRNARYGDDPTFLVLSKFTKIAKGEIPNKCILLTGHVSRNAHLVYLPAERNYDNLP